VPRVKVSRYRRKGRRVRSHKRGSHLYRGKGTRGARMREFERRYARQGRSKADADYIYGATVGKVARERRAKRGRR
jgi:hypothetical protein